MGRGDKYGLLSLRTPLDVAECITVDHNLDAVGGESLGCDT